MKLLINRNITDITIEKEAKDSLLRLLYFLASKMLHFQIRTIAFILSIAILIVCLGVSILRGNSGNISIIGKSVFIIILLSVVSVLEEFAHSVVCIRKGKTDVIKEIRISSWYCGNIRLLVESVGIHISGKMNYRDLLHVTAAGPLFAFFNGAIIFFLLWFWGINKPSFSVINFYISVHLFILPLFSLLPFSLTFHSDGKRILEIISKCGLNKREILGELFMSFILVYGFMPAIKLKNTNK